MSKRDRQHTRTIEAARKEAQRAYERGDQTAVRHFEAIITRENEAWGGGR